MLTELKRILYLEDDLSIAELAIIGLADIGGFEVRHYTVGQDAVAAAAGFRPQLCLFDVMLPDMDGPQTLRQIRDTPEGRGVAAIFMTAKAQVHEQRAYVAMGVLGVIMKPFDPVTLAARIRTFWTGQPAAVRE